MSKYRYAAKIDGNEKEIVKLLRQIPGVTVEQRHDDILVGRAGVTRWYEVKNPERAANKSGKVYESAKEKSQKRLDEEWTGHRKTVTTIDEILEDMGIQ